MAKFKWKLRAAKRRNRAKNHSTNKERSHDAKARHRRWLFTSARARKKQKARLAAARAYWRGEATELREI